jgi:membrane protein implicated in regulation of membrane protease activity
MLEKIVLAVGCLIGIVAGLAFYSAVEQLSLPAPLFFIVDIFGVLAGSILVGLCSILIAVGILVLAVDRFFSDRETPQDP